MKIKVEVQTKKIGSKCTRIIEVPDEDAADEELIEELAYESLWEMIDWDWKRIDG